MPKISVKPRSSYEPTRRNGFTLIELLVVVAIISLLAAILFPVFARARENARRTSCQSNLKQMGIGIIQYVQDYDEYYPLARAYVAGPPQWTNTWYNADAPYVKNNQIFSCPSDPNSAVSAGTFWMGSTPLFHVSYGYSKVLGGNGSYTVPVAASAVNFPSTTVMVVDGDAVPVSSVDPASWSSKTSLEPAGTYSPWIVGSIPDVATTGLVQTNSDYQNYTGPSARHLGTCNVLYIDGHVKAQRVETFYSMTTYSPCLNIATGCG